MDEIHQPGFAVSNNAGEIPALWKDLASSIDVYVLTGFLDFAVLFFEPLRRTSGRCENRDLPVPVTWYPVDLLPERVRLQSWSHGRWG